MGVLNEAVVALRRRSTYTGQLREAARVAAVVALYPLGVANSAVDAAVSWGGGSIPCKPEDASSTPVLLVHGCGGNKSSWISLTAHLRQAGYGHIETMNYNAATATVPEIAERLVKRVEAMRTRTGSDKVHLVGHSLGGVILRYAVTELGLDAHTSAALTIASPHGDTPVAHIGVFAQRCGLHNAAADITPGSVVLARLDRSNGGRSVRWTAYYSNLDMVVPARAAQLHVAGLRVTNILIRDAGHVGLLLDHRLLKSVTSELRAADANADPKAVELSLVTPRRSMHTTLAKSA